MYKHKFYMLSITESDVNNTAQDSWLSVKTISKTKLLPQIRCTSNTTQRVEFFLL